MRAKKSLMQLETIRVESNRVEWSLSALDNETGPVDYSVNIDFDLVSIDNKGRKYGIRLMLKVNERKESAPFKAKVELLGVFKFISEDISEERKIRFLLLNGLTMLYSFARGYLFAKLDSLPPDARLIPTVDILSIVERKAKRKKVKT